MIQFTIPMPPPLSACFRNASGPGRVKTPRYERWKRDAGWIVRAQRPGSIHGPVRVTYLIGRPDKRKRDLGNLDKALSDLLVHLRVIDDDSKIVDLRLVWAERDDVLATVEAV